MKRINLLFGFAIVSMFLLGSCGEKTTGEKIEEHAEEVGEEIEDAAEETAEDIEEAAEAIGTIFGK